MNSNLNRVAAPLTSVLLVALVTAIMVLHKVPGFLVFAVDMAWNCKTDDDVRTVVVSLESGGVLRINQEPIKRGLLRERLYTRSSAQESNVMHS